MAEMTFKTRVQRFWAWYVQASPRFIRAVEANQCPELEGEVGAMVNEVLPGFAWEFGRGENGDRSFTLSGEGNLHRQLLALYWQSQAPSLPGWTFYPARQPGEIDGTRMRIGDQDFNPLEFWLTPSLNREDEKVDLTVWHPRFESMAEQDRWRVLFLFLDEALGEFGTQQWLGEIQLNNQRLTDSMPLRELAGFIQKVEAETGWEKFPPGDAGIVYRSEEEPHNSFLRGDVIIGSTTQPALLNEYLDAEGNLDDPLAGTGADYVFIAFDAGFLPEGRQSDARGVLEDALEEALQAAASGRVLGGALGTRFAYIDLLLYDGLHSLEIVRQVAREQGLPEGSAVNFFAREKRGHRLVL